ncbi:hypothetical protein KR038_009584 [Drosophila bunnanda]|nr:hypothetical protein KR038_009584 [Drosophila bunnanda]
MTFFGLTMKPDRQYTRLLQKPFSVRGVAIKEGDMGKVYVITKDEKHIIATVSEAIPQAQLDLQFGKCEEITFAVEGEATVCLTGTWYEEDYADAKKQAEDDRRLLEKVITFLDTTHDADDEHDSEEESQNSELKTEN